MKEEYLDIVAEIVRHLAEDEGASPRDRSIIEGLLDEGYDLMDIDDALSWFESLGGSSEDLFFVEHWPGFKGVRVQARWERESMSDEAYAYLMKLNSGGILDDSLREAIMDKVVDLSIADFGVGQMRALLGLILYSTGRVAKDPALDRLLEGGSGGSLN